MSGISVEEDHLVVGEGGMYESNKTRRSRETWDWALRRYDSGGVITARQEDAQKVVWVLGQWTMDNGRRDKQAAISKQFHQAISNLI